MAWDLTVVDTLVESYITVCANPGGAAACCDQEVVKICILSNSYIFQSLALETLDPQAILAFLSSVSWAMEYVSGGLRKTMYLFQQLSLLV